jgi:hypothetical protein
MQADAKFRFQADSDRVLVMLTGFNRFSWLANDGQDWHTHGDLDTWAESQDARENYPWVQPFRDRMWSAKMAVQQSWLAARTMKQSLVDRGCPHTLLMSLDNSHYVTDGEILGLSSQEIEQAKEIYQLLDYKESFDQFRIRQGYSLDLHPGTKEHQAFAQAVFPELYCPDALSRQIGQEKVTNPT